MNKQGENGITRGIEWTDYTWNPVGGCRHGCAWLMPDGNRAQCYARTIAEGNRDLWPRGFEWHYWNPKRLDDPAKLKTPARIFLDSMSDLMGRWVPPEQINAVFNACRAAPWHTFQLLTKNAPRLKDFVIPPNVWIGVSAPPSEMFGKSLSRDQQMAMVYNQLTILRGIDVPVKWMSIEPLSFDIAPLLKDCGLQWVVIGAATYGRKIYHPQPVWLKAVLKMMAQQRIPVFFKGNLRNEPDADPWREEFPQMVTAPVYEQANLF